jgi:hypothetical protein
MYNFIECDKVEERSSAVLNGLKYKRHFQIKQKYLSLQVLNYAPLAFQANGQAIALPGFLILTAIFGGLRELDVWPLWSIKDGIVRENGLQRRAWASS